MRFTKQDIKLLSDFLEHLSLEAVEECYHANDDSQEAHERYGMQICRRIDAINTYDKLKELSERLNG